MRKNIIIIFLFSLFSSLNVFNILDARAKIVDPFINPIEKMKQSAFMKKKKGQGKKIKKVSKVNLFKSKIPRPLSSMNIQGIIMINKVPYIVLMDPKTGQVFLLKEGDAVASDTKIVSISGNEIILEKYSRYKGVLRKKKFKMKVNLEG